MDISSTKSWYKYFFIGLFLDFVVVFLPDMIRPLMGRDILDDTERVATTLIFAILGIRTLFFALSFLPSPSIDLFKYQTNKNNIQILIILLAVFIFMFISNIGNLLQHFGYANYVFVQDYKFLVQSILTLLTRNIFDFIPRLFRKSTEDLTKLLSVIALTVSALTLVGSLTLSLLTIAGLLLNIDKLTF